VQIQVHTDKSVTVSDGLAQHVEGQIETALSHSGGQVTRVDVHLSDEAGSGPKDLRCTMEVRLAGKQPLAVTHHAETVGEACTGAAHKLKALVEKHTRTHSHKGGESIRHLDVTD
jgi:ribosome-associated translation inhibitor RaiA